MPSESNKAVPPWEIKTNGTPVKGKTPIIEAIFINDWAVIIVTNPIASNFEKASGAFLIAIR